MHPDGQLSSQFDFSKMCKYIVILSCARSCVHLSLKGRTLTATVTHESSPSFSSIVPWGTITLGIAGFSNLLAPITVSWLMLRSSLPVVRLLLEGNEVALVLDRSKDDGGLLVAGTLGSCRRFLEPGLALESADILSALLD